MHDAMPGRREARQRVARPEVRERDVEGARVIRDVERQRRFGGSYRGRL